MPDLSPLLRARFTPGQTVTDRDINRFNTFLPRLDDESDQKYAQRLVAAGFARLTTSEQLRDLGAYRQLSREAEAQGIPILVMTAELTQPAMRPAREMLTVDDVLDRTTGKMHASGDAGPNRNDPYTAATKKATEAGDPGHAKGGNSGEAK